MERLMSANDGPKGDPKIIEKLNEVLTSELTAINQYFIHSKMLANWGYKKLAKDKYEESIEEMKDADKVIDRILYLDGIPNMQRLNPVRVGETITEMHTVDLALEVGAVERLNSAIGAARAVGDNGTRMLLEEILTGEEHAVDHLEAQLGIIKAIGEAAYLAEHIHE
jgi:bacterioferritin